MSQKLRTSWGGINTDIHPHRLPSGTATEAVNVTVEDGSLRKRYGFAEYEDDVNGSATAVKGLWQANFADGSVFVIAKLADGTLWRQQVHPTASADSSFVAMRTGHTHNGSYRGWAGHWADRWHYSDPGGTTRFCHSVRAGTAQAGGASTITLDSGASSLDDFYNNMCIKITGGTGSGQYRTISDYTGSTKIATVSVAWGTAPAVASTFRIEYGYKAGLPRATTGATPIQAAGGEKNGWYRTVPQLRNSVTAEEGMFAGPQATAVECRRETGDTRSGLSISNWTTLRGVAAYLAYEWDQVHFGCTSGNTEYRDEGSGYQLYSHVYYDDALCQRDAATAGLNKADEIHQREERFWNNGGEPPGSEVGCFTETRGIYGRVYASSALVPGKVMFSLSGFPTMVPQRHTYTQGGDSKTVDPRPWVGEYLGGVCGALVAIAYGGGHTCLFTPTSAHLMKVRSDGSMYAVKVVEGKGAVGDGAVVGTTDGVHALGHRSWLHLAYSQTTDIAFKRFSGLLAETPLAYQANSVLGSYSHKGQTWAAITKSGATKVQRILVWDPAAGHGGALVKFDLACLADDESITALCELNYPGAEPSMLVATSAGRILVYPSGDDDDGTDFACEWTGVFAQERLEYDQGVHVVRVHCGDNVGGNVTLEFKALQTAEQTMAGSDTAIPWSTAHSLHKNNNVERVGVEFDKLHGNVFLMRIVSSASVTDRWAIYDLVWTVERSDRAT